MGKSSEDKASQDKLSQWEFIRKKSAYQYEILKHNVDLSENEESVNYRCTASYRLVFIVLGVLSMALGGGLVNYWLQHEDVTVIFVPLGIALIVMGMFMAGTAFMCAVCDGTGMEDEESLLYDPANSFRSQATSVISFRRSRSTKINVEMEQPETDNEERVSGTTSTTVHNSTVLVTPTLHADYGSLLAA